MISLMVHAAAFLLAGLLVVFEVLDKPDVKFTPPPKIERPKMDLKRPPVKVKNIKSRATRRILWRKIFKSWRISVAGNVIWSRRPHRRV
jgi:hypothetical protein